MISNNYGYPYDGGTKKAVDDIVMGKPVKRRS
jgi:hypothetical protein